MADPFEGMSPIDRLKLRMSLANQATVSPEQRAANYRQTGEEVLSVLPVIGNAMAARDAYKGAGEAYNAFSQGDYKRGGLNGLLAAISGVGAVTGLPFGKMAGNVAKAAPDTLFSGAGPTSKAGGPLKAYPVAPKGEWYGDANYEITGGRMTEMTPDAFLARARPMEVDDVARDNIDDLKQHMQSGRTLDPLAFYKNGQEDGRHRAIAAKELGIKKVPVLVWDE